MKRQEIHLCHNVVPEAVNFEDVPKPKHGTKHTGEHHAAGEEQPQVHSFCHNPTEEQARVSQSHASYILEYLF